MIPYKAWTPLDLWGVWWWVAYGNLVSTLCPNPSSFSFWGTFIQLGGLLGQDRAGQGLGFGPGLDNKDLKVLIV